MIKFPPSGVAFSLFTHPNNQRCLKETTRFGEGVRETKTSLEGFTITTSWQGTGIQAALTHIGSEPTYVRELSIQLHYRSPKPAGQIILWTEGEHAGAASHLRQPAAGTLSQGRSRKGSWALWMGENQDSEGLFLHVNPPHTGAVNFYCRPKRHSLLICWPVGKRLQPGQSISLTPITVTRSPRIQAVTSWRRRWTPTTLQPPLASMRIGWCGDQEISSPQVLQSTIATLRKSGLAPEWFALGPQYAMSVGDWLRPTQDFRDRMSGISRTIRSSAIQPALRFAPFLASRKSTIALEHPDWFVQNSSQKILTTQGYVNPRDTALILDVTHPEVVEHIRKTLEMAHRQWGFQLFILERISDALLPGLRSNPELGTSDLAQQVRHLLSNTIPSAAIITTDAPVAGPLALGQARTVAPPCLSQPRSATQSAEALLANAPWNEGGRLNASGLLPAALVEGPEDSGRDALLDAAALTCGVLMFTGNPMKLNEERAHRLRKAYDLFADSRDGRVHMAQTTDKGKRPPLVIRNARGWVALFNFSEKRAGITLSTELLKSRLGASALKSAEAGAAFNSPEIHVVLPPRGHRLFKG
ncbi:MAG: alpha-galactosidase [Spirochaetales bacterium]|nr:alpha-galactosidase [Spirochaetales bacterium]